MLNGTNDKAAAGGGVIFILERFQTKCNFFKEWSVLLSLSILAANFGKCNHLIDNEMIHVYTYCILDLFIK